MVRVTVHFRWPVSPQDAPITQDLVNRIAPYLTRYGKTLGATVFAVGGANDHLHLLLDTPSDRALNYVISEMKTASERFVCETLRMPNFAWHTSKGFAVSVGLDAVQELSEYIQNNEAIHASGMAKYYWEFDALTPSEQQDETSETLPHWLADALQKEKL